MLFLNVLTAAPIVVGHAIAMVSGLGFSAAELPRGKRRALRRDFSRHMRRLSSTAFSTDWKILAMYSVGSYLCSYGYEYCYTGSQCNPLMEGLFSAISPIYLQAGLGDGHFTHITRSVAMSLAAHGCQRHRSNTMLAHQQSRIDAGSFRPLRRIGSLRDYLVHTDM